MAKGIITTDELRREVERLDWMFSGNSAGFGPKIVARAWTDPEFKQLLLKDGNTAVKQCVDVSLSGWVDVKLIVVENTEKVHNLIVCTLCSVSFELKVALGNILASRSL